MAGGGRGAGAKQDDFQPQPVEEQLPGVECCINSPPKWPEAFVLGFQHYLVMLGTTVLIPSIIVPQMGGAAEEKAVVIQTLQFVAGINTLIQSYFGTRLPAVIGGSFTFVVPTLSIVLANRYDFITDPHERFRQAMRGVQGALMAASSFQIIIGFSGLWRNVVRFLSPLSATPIVVLSGLGLYFFGFPAVSKCIEMGLPQLILLVLSQYLPGVVKGKRFFIHRSSVLISIAVIWVYAHILTVGGAYKSSPTITQYHCRTDRAGLISASSWIRVPYPFQWGSPTFKSGEAFAMMAASFAALIESTGTLIAVQRFSGATPIPPSVFSRGVGWQGLAILLNGMFGTLSGSTASPENAGYLALTRVGSRRVIYISAGFMLFFSVFGKIGAFFASIPMPIVGAMYCIFFAYVASAGLGLLQFCNLNAFRTKFILGFSLFLGISVPQYFREYTMAAGYGPVHTRSNAFNDILDVIFSSPATVAAIVACFLDLTLTHGDSSVRRDRGLHWWEKFRSFKGDPRSEEFYSLPWNLNKYFPSL